MKPLLRLSLVYWFNRRVDIVLYRDHMTYTWYRWMFRRDWIGDFGKVTLEQRSNPDNWHEYTGWHCVLASGRKF